ncbi:hypothetical protein VNI00_017452 [Paramarasmius palmivorus]|uniref:Uncharacterized protein n=1 Tax=Paramarasmius palmivorus TaxID=297713 RepID=A0AAW0B5K3_9AGAR
MAFTGTQDLTIAGNATNIVHGDQYNSNTHIVKSIRVQQRTGRVLKQRRARKKETEIDLIDEYREIRLGDIYKVEQTGSDERREWNQDDDGQNTWKKTGERTFYRAKLYGDDNMFTAITYTGRDASKLWREDFAVYSESQFVTSLYLLPCAEYPSNTAMTFQLFGVNRSKVPALLFYDDWIPMAHFCPSGNFWTKFYARLLFEYMNCAQSELWVNSQSGYFSIGPAGPPVGVAGELQHILDNLCCTTDILNIDTCVRYLSKMASQDLDIDVLAYTSGFWGSDSACVSNLLGVGHQCSQACVNEYSFLEWAKDNAGLWRRKPQGYIDDKVLDFLDDPEFSVVYSATQFREIVFSKGKGCLPSSLHALHPALYDQTVVAGGVTRFLFDFSLAWEEPGTLLGVISTFGNDATWLSQAHCIFNNLDNINDIEKYCLDFAPECLDSPCSEYNESFDQADDPDTESPVYLFVQPPPTRLSEVDAWLNSQVFFWSYDENGTTQITEHIQRCLGLPKLTLNGPQILLRSWRKYVYDAIHKWQVARGFDPTTSDFARSLRYSILQPVPNKDVSASREDFNAEPTMSRIAEALNNGQSDIADSPTLIEDKEMESSSEDDQEPELESFMSKFQSTLSWWQATSDIPAFG